MIDHLDHETVSHQNRVSDLCVMMGRILGLHEGYIAILKLAGALHDVGKSGIPKKIIEKNGPLTAEERSIVQDHARMSYLKLEENDYHTVKKVVVAHHEFSRKPYPRNDDRCKNGRCGPDRRDNNDSIRLMAQILALCDMFDALSSQRDYKEAFDIDETFRIIENDFTGDADLVTVMKTVVYELNGSEGGEREWR